MSLMTMMLALSTGLAVRRPDREAELKAEVDALKTELAQIRGERDALRRVIEDEWRLREIQRQREHSFMCYQDGHLAQQTAQHVQAQQMNMQAMQNAMSQMPLGRIPEGFICNCVPARHDMFLCGG